MGKITVGIDATNIRQGGGVTHLTQILVHANFNGDSDIAKVVLWSNNDVATLLPDFPWLEKVCPPWADSKFSLRIFNQLFTLPSLVKQAKCDVLFSPGGSLPLSSPVPTVTMSQNMLPFEPKEADLFGRWSAMWLKLKLLRQSQVSSFRRSDGLIFLTEYARKVVMPSISGFKGYSKIIPHGIEDRFQAVPRQQLPIDRYSVQRPYRLLYVSILMPYKHQLEVATAVHLLRTSGLPISIRFIGPDWQNNGFNFRDSLMALDSNGEYLEYSGALSFGELHSAYQDADAFVFASSCENLPNILIEAMSAGLPIACSNLGPMPEVLGDSGLYFDPTDSTSIASALKELVSDPRLRDSISMGAWRKSQSFSWHRCAKDTFKFIAAVALKNN